MTKRIIAENDVVAVNFHGAQFTLVYRGIVHYKPCATGDSWIIEDIASGQVHYISEGCTISLLEKAKPDNRF